MAYTIAFAGKGGTGKTTLAAITIRLIREMNLGSVLAVDADPNSNLGEILGADKTKSIGEIIDEVSQGILTVPAGIGKDSFIEYQIQNNILETDNFDLLVMGRPEGPGCYCYVNNLLRGIFSKISNNYDFTVIDNEAGLEHLSRKTTREADIFLIIADYTKVGIDTALRISKIIDELKIKTKDKYLILNRYDGQVEQKIREKLNLKFLGNIPFDQNLQEISQRGSSIFELEENSSSIKAIKRIFSKIVKNDK